METLQNALNKESYYICHYEYSDKSGSGVLPRLLNESDKKLLELAGEHLQFQVLVTFIKIENN